MSFAESLEIGKVGESVISRWIMSHGRSVLPVYEKEIDEGKGPQFFMSVRQAAAPDMFVFPTCIWAEAKHKSVFSWYRKTGNWVTGIDLNHYTDYQLVQERSERPVWLLFLHRQSQPAQCDIQHCPHSCPTGLYGGDLSHLVKIESHRSDRWGRHGMVYWAEQNLQKLASLDQVYRRIAA